MHRFLVRILAGFLWPCLLLTPASSEGLRAIADLRPQGASKTSSPSVFFEQALQSREIEIRGPLRPTKESVNVCESAEHTRRGAVGGILAAAATVITAGVVMVIPAGAQPPPSFSVQTLQMKAAKRKWDPQFEDWLLTRFMPSARALSIEVQGGRLTWSALRSWSEEQLDGPLHTALTYEWPQDLHALVRVDDAMLFWDQAVLNQTLVRCGYIAPLPLVQVPDAPRPFRMGRVVSDQQILSPARRQVRLFVVQFLKNRAGQPLNTAQPSKDPKNSPPHIFGYTTNLGVVIEDRSPLYTQLEQLWQILRNRRFNENAEAARMEISRQTRGAVTAESLEDPVSQVLERPRLASYRKEPALYLRELQDWAGKRLMMEEASWPKMQSIFEALDRLEELSHNDLIDRLNLCARCRWLALDPWRKLNVLARAIQPGSFFMRQLEKQPPKIKAHTATNLVNALVEGEAQVNAIRNSGDDRVAFLLFVRYLPMGLLPQALEDPHREGSYYLRSLLRPLLAAEARNQPESETDLSDWLKFVDLELGDDEASIRKLGRKLRSASDSAYPHEFLPGRDITPLRTLDDDHPFAPLASDHPQNLPPPATRRGLFFAG